MNFLRRIFFQILYLREPPWDTGISPPELTAFIDAHPPGRAVDLGCGNGTNAITLAQHGWQVTGVDFVSRAIRNAKKKARQMGLSINFQVEDVTRLKDINGPFDLILDIGCFHSLTEEGKSAYVHNIRRLLAPDGTFLMYVHFQDPEGNQNVIGSGLVEDDMRLLATHLTLTQRQDGSERGLRPSAWFWYNP
jgi:SAM-dependent methyltransferase